MITILTDDDLKKLSPEDTAFLAGFCAATDSATSFLYNFWLEEEYVEPPKPEVDWDNVPVDTLVRVRDLESEEWTLKYFKGIDEEAPESRFMAWDNGATSKTAYGNYTHWVHCELVEEEDDDK